MEANKIIVKPLLTEKSYAGIANKVYTFVVAKNAGKVEIKKAVEELFGVKVAKVNTVNVRGQMRRRGRTSGYTRSWKKAYVTLTEDSKALEFFEGMM